MKYQEMTTLARRGAVEQMANEDVDGILLVSDKVAVSWNGDHKQTGYNSISLSPAVHNGKRAWLLEKYWVSASGYSCTGLTSQEIIPFERGANLVLNQGAFGHLFPNGSE